MTLQIPEAKCRLHVRMRNWPCVDDGMALYLLHLHWRIRKAVILTHGEELTQDQVAAQLRVSVRTVRHYLRMAYDAYEEAFRGENN